MSRLSLPSSSALPNLSAERVALAVAGYGYGSRLPLPVLPLSDDVFESMLSIAQHDRLLGAVAQLVSEGHFPATDDQRQLLTDMHSGWLHHAIIVERLLLRVGAILESSHIDFRVLKGVAFAHLLYADASWRVFGDLDLLIPSDRFDEAVQLARTELGGVQPVPELRPGFDREFGKEALIRVGRVELDLHRTFVTGPFGLTIDLDGLFAGKTSFEVGGSHFAALENTALFLHVCYNLALGDDPVRTCSLRDLLVAHEQLDVDNDTIIQMARVWQASAVVQRAAELTVRTLKIDADHGLWKLTDIAVPRRESWLLRSYLTSARSYSRPLASLVVIGGLRARLRYARALFSPSAEYLSSRGWTERGHLRQARDRLLHHD